MAFEFSGPNAEPTPPDESAVTLGEWSFPKKRSHPTANDGYRLTDADVAHVYMELRSLLTELGGTATDPRGNALALAFRTRMAQFMPGFLGKRASLAAFAAEFPAPSDPNAWGIATNPSGDPVMVAWDTDATPPAWVEMAFDAASVAGKINRSGDTATGPINQIGSTGPMMPMFSGLPGHNAGVVFGKNGAARVAVFSDANPENGSDTGSGFHMGVYDDNGTWLGALMTGERHTRKVFFHQNAPSSHAPATGVLDLVRKNEMDAAIAAAVSGGGLSYSESAEIAVPTTFTTWAHGLGVRPKVFGVRYRCKVAELGYSVGDEVNVSGAIHPPPASSGGYYTKPITADATQVTIGSVTVIPWPKKTGQYAYGNLTHANWRCIAWALN